MCDVACRGQAYRYVWANASRRPTNLANALMKLDTRTGEVLMWHEDGALPGGSGGGGGRGGKGWEERQPS